MKQKHVARLLSALAVTALLTACSNEFAGQFESQALNEESLVIATAADPGANIPNRYILIFTDDVANGRATAAAMVRAARGELHFVYENVLNGFAATLPPQAVANLQRNPNIAYIEQDAVVTLNATTQTNATWGLDRIDQPTRPLNGTYIYNNTGAGVRAYIIDTGIRTTHSEFTGRTLPGYTAINDGRGTDDCNGHGTHVAGTVGGTVYGVAKGVTLVPVRVLDCQGSGTWSGVIAGVDWVAAQKRANPSIPMVANMSLGGGASSTIDQAVTNSVQDGVVQVVAAGNSTRDACDYSPARAPLALTVGATTESDSRASYSNFGTCLDLFAPGSSITSAWSSSNTSVSTISGTSMASPHVAGVVALILEQRPTATPVEVSEILLTATVTGILSSVGTGSPNRLLQSQIVLSAPPLTITTTALPDASVDQPYSATLRASGGAGDSTWTTSALPAGLSLTGATISGTPSAAGTTSVTVTVNDDSGEVSKELTLTVTPAPIAVEPATISITTEGGRWLSGNAQVTIRASDAPHATAAGVSVSGSWLVNGQLQSSSVSATTNSDGIASFNSPTYRVTNGTLGFCVRSLSGAGVASIAFNPPLCEGTGVGSDPVAPPPSDDEPVDPPPGEDDGQNPPPADRTPPLIDAFSLARSTSGPWRNVDVSWAVRDDVALLSLRLEGRASNGNLLVSETITLTGTEASGVTRLRERSDIATVVLIVTDAAGNQSTATR
jgi:subtilisin family serine protease